MVCLPRFARCDTCSRSRCLLCYLIDESRPLCTRCAKSGIECEGYQDNQAFVWVDPKKPDTKQNTGNAESSSSAKTGAAPSNETLSVQPTSAAHQEAFFASIDPAALQNFVHSILPPKLGSPTFQESIYQTHLFQHLLGYTEIGKDSALSFPVMNAMDLNRFVASSSIVDPFFCVLDGQRYGVLWGWWNAISMSNFSVPCL